MLVTQKIPLIVVAGPTASGKTEVGINLAKKLNGEVISADSMQIYKGLDIATAKPTIEEMEGIPHHLISIIDPNVEFSVADYLELAKKAIDDVFRRGKMPILVGGTGLYISSLVNNVNFEDAETDGSIRERLVLESEQVGREKMLERLSAIDLETAETLHFNNISRVIRALEIYELTGMKFSEYKKKNCLGEESSPYSACMIGLNYEDRGVLYNRINRRVDLMIETGMIEEAFAVYNSGGILKTAHQAIGYKELLPFFNKNATLDECTEKIKRESRRYAKRQLTWFRRDERINWLNLSEMINSKKIIEDCLKVVEKSKII